VDIAVVYQEGGDAINSYGVVPAKPGPIRRAVAVRKWSQWPFATTNIGWLWVPGLRGDDACYASQALLIPHEYAM